MRLYWHLNLFTHFRAGLTVNISFFLFPFSSWRVGGTTHRIYQVHEQRQFGPLKVEWFDRNTRYQ
jgi:hypothetical protein